MFKRSPPDMVNVPLHEMQETQAKEAMILRARRGHFELALRGIQNTINTYPSLAMSEGSLDEYRFNDIKQRRHGNGSVRAARFMDGVAVAFTTQGWLEDKAHYLVAPTHGTLEYGVSAINVDCQLVGSRTRVLYGAEELAQDESAIMHLQYCAGALALESVTGWQHALQKHQLEGVRRP